MTRTERYLARLAGQDVSIPDTPITREEEYLAYIIENGGGVPAPNAGAHNSIFRGKNLGSTYTQAQADAIDAGTFDDLYIGDYWTINGVTYRIAAFDFYYQLGVPKFLKHHAVIMPDTIIGPTCPINSEASATGGYKNSEMKNTTLPAILSDVIIPAFGDGNILSRYSVLGTGANSGDYTLTRIDLLDEVQVFGFFVAGRAATNGEKKTKFPLFTLAPQYSAIASAWWLQTQTNTDSFELVGANGSYGVTAMTAVQGVRPYFCLGKAPTP